MGRVYDLVPYKRVGPVVFGMSLDKLSEDLEVPPQRLGVSRMWRSYRWV